MEQLKWINNQNLSQSGARHSSDNYILFVTLFLINIIKLNKLDWNYL